MAVRDDGRKRELCEMTDEMRDIEGETFAEWASHTLAYEYCDDCGGDVEHHDPGFLLGHWIAVCKYPMNEETGELHPVIAAYQAAQDAKGQTA